MPQTGLVRAVDCGARAESLSFASSSLSALLGVWEADQPGCIMGLFTLQFLMGFNLQAIQRVGESGLGCVCPSSLPSRSPRGDASFHLLHGFCWAAISMHFFLWVLETIVPCYPA